MGSWLVGGPGFPCFLTPDRPKNITSKDPSGRPFRPGPPPPPALLHLFGKGQKARGKTWLSRLRAVWAWEYDELGPPDEQGPLASPKLALLKIIFGPRVGARGLELA